MASMGVWVCCAAPQDQERIVRSIQECGGRVVEPKDLVPRSFRARSMVWGGCRSMLSAQRGCGLISLKVEGFFCGHMQEREKQVLLVANKPRRTSKYFFGLAAGIRPVKPNFVDKCVQQVWRRPLAPVILQRLSSSSFFVGNREPFCSTRCGRFNSRPENLRMVGAWGFSHPTMGADIVFLSLLSLTLPGTM